MLCKIYDDALSCLCYYTSLIIIFVEKNVLTMSNIFAVFTRVDAPNCVIDFCLLIAGPTES